MPIRLYSVSSCHHPSWGDYGDLMVRGFAYAGPNGTRLERTGPFVPAVFLPDYPDNEATDVRYSFMVTGSAMQAIQDEGFAGLSFGPVEVTRAIDLAWHEWNQDDWPDNDYMARISEPSAVMLDVHSETVRRQMPPIFGAIVESCVEVSIPGLLQADFTEYISSASLDGSSFVTSPHSAKALWVDDRAKAVLSRLGGAYMRFEPVIITDSDE